MAKPKAKPLAITGSHADGRAFAKKLTSRTRDVRIDVADLKTVDLGAVRSIALRELYVRSQALEAIAIPPLAGLPIERLKLVLPPLIGVDLSPVAGSSIRELVLCGGPRTLDLTPLATCRALEQILYFEAPLAEIDLAPLAACRGLTLMWLSHNELATLDLRPLAKLPALHALELSDCELASVELGSEPGFASLTHLHLHDNPLRELDLRALAPRRMRVLNLPIGLRDRVELSSLGPARKDLEINFR